MPKKRKVTEETHARRKHGTGTVSHRKDGRWQYSYLHEGKRHTGYAASYEEADQLVLAAIADAQKHGFVDSQMPLGEYLEQWLTDIEPRTRANTHYHWGLTIRRRIIPALVRFNKKTVRLGTIPLADLGRRQFQDLVNSWNAEDLKPATVQAYFTPVRAAIIDAIQAEIIAYNPCAHIKLPSLEQIEDEEATVLSIEQCQALLAEAKGHWLYPIIMGALLGLRLGELLSLKWTDINFEAGTLRVRRSVAQIPETGLVEDLPKSRSSRRTLTIPGFILSILKQHRTEQNVVRLQAGDAWQDLDLVFCRDDGTHRRQGTVRKAFRVMLRRADLPEITFHGLRHSTATILLALNIPIAVVSKFLGHANPGITMRIYAHVLPGQDGEAMGTYNQAFGGKQAN